MIKRSALYLLLLASLFARAQFNYGHQMDFGKNRVQYKEFVWTYFDYERYRVYSYQGGTEIAKYVSTSLAKQMAILEKRLDYQIDEKINILVYNTQDDFKQSNLGLSSEEQSNIGGVTRIIGDKINVYFNGSHAELDQQIRAALAELLVNKILYGGNVREMVRNSTLLYIPEWYSQGLVKYLSEGWTTTNDNIMYDGLKSESFSSFNRLTGRQAANSGHALWYFVVSTYGESMIPNILYMTRVTRSLDNAFVSTLGVTLDNLVYDFYESYQRRIFMFRDSTRKSPFVLDNSALRRYKSSQHFYQVKLSPDGEKIAYACNELNQIKVFCKNTKTKGSTLLLKLGPKVEQLEDYNYPLIAWHPNGDIVSMIYVNKGELVLHIYNFESKEVVKRPLAGFEKINSMNYSPDGKKMVFSAVKKAKGQSDVFVFGINTGGIEQLSNDIWDDQNPVFIKKGKQVVFESNRLNDTIKATDDARYFVKFNRNMDLFMAPYPFTSKVLVRISNTPDVNETYPQAYTDNYITYLSDKNGINNRYLAEFDSSIAFVDTTEHYRYYFKSRPVTNYDRNITEQSINPAATHVAERYYYNVNDFIKVSELPPLQDIRQKEPMNTWYRGFVSPAVMNPSDYKDYSAPDNTSSPKTESNTRGIDFE
ncbi:MAG: PD40 domain-containing protein, partial [Bacteroidia bacterium]|nr:PD40 domain-containing protein [Bacteroidia bacterium]